VNSSAILLSATSLLIIVSGFAWVMLLRYSQRLSWIDSELRMIKVMLNEIPKENSLKEYMFAQDLRLSDIRENLDTYASTNALQQYIQDQANQIIAVISTHEETEKEVITRTDLEHSLQITNELLEKILWSLRFDEDNYAEDTGTKSASHEEQEKKVLNFDTKSANTIQDMNNHVSMMHLLNEHDDGYDAMLEYMQQSGKSGTDALQALEAAKTCEIANITTRSI